MLYEKETVIKYFDTKTGKEVAEGDYYVAKYDYYYMFHPFFLKEANFRTGENPGSEREADGSAA